MENLIKNIILSAIIIMLAICTDHAIEHRQKEVKPVEKDFHCVKLHEVKVKFNIVLGCAPIEK
tara:strand:- start:4454 stop:4642 length:189 start_codon:yes stop_codon:yes gene_type:complete